MQFWCGLNNAWLVTKTCVGCGVLNAYEFGVAPIRLPFKYTLA